jgi:cob(I)alamin adenosyltransferase
MSRSIATRTGDDGTTSLLYGQRVAKTHPQIEAVGACDDLNVALGAARLVLAARPRDEELRTLITALQANLVALMGEVACAETDRERYQNSAFAKVTGSDVERLDQEIARLESRGLKFAGWATPGANAVSLAFDQARVVARRAERRLHAVVRGIRPEVAQWINRLSDLLWLLAREAEQ